MSISFLLLLFLVRSLPASLPPLHSVYTYTPFKKCVFFYSSFNQLRSTFEIFFDKCVRKLSSCLTTKCVCLIIRVKIKLGQSKKCRKRQLTWPEETLIQRQLKRISKKGEKPLKYKRRSDCQRTCTKQILAVYTMWKAWERRPTERFLLLF